MKLSILKKPRIFRVGEKKTLLKDFGKIFLQNDEMISFNFLKKDDYDFTKKSWGFYVSQSIEQRMKSNNFTLFLVKNISSSRFYLLARYKGKESEFKNYLKQEKIKIVVEFSKKNLVKIEKSFRTS